jgi:hypothetical protein
MPLQASVSVRFDRPGPAGLEVDSQQRAAAIEEASLDQVPAGIAGFPSTSEAEQRTSSSAQRHPAAARVGAVPGKSRLLHGAGVGSLGPVMDAI